MPAPHEALALSEARIRRVVALPEEERRQEVAVYATALYDQLGSDALLGFGQQFEPLYYTAACPNAALEPTEVDVFATPYLEALLEHPDTSQAYRAGRRVHKWRQVPFGRGSIDRSPLSNVGILALQHGS